MADGNEQFRIVVDIINSIITPVNQTLTKHTEAVNLSISLINKLVELYSQEPTRITIVKELRDELIRCSDEYKRLIATHEYSCKERNDESIDAAVLKMKDQLGITENSIKAHADNKHQEIKTEVKAISTPVTAWDNRMKWLFLAIGISYTLFLGGFVYFYPKYLELSANMIKIMSIIEAASKASGS